MTLKVIFAIHFVLQWKASYNDFPHKRRIRTFIFIIFCYLWEHWRESFELHNRSDQPQHHYFHWLHQWHLWHALLSLETNKTVLLLWAETGDRVAVVQSSLSHLTLKFQPNFSTKFRMPKDFWKAFNELKFKIGFWAHKVPIRQTS